MTVESGPRFGEAFPRTAHESRGTVPQGPGTAPGHRRCAQYFQLFRSAPAGAYFSMCAVIFVISSFIGGPQQCGAIGWKTISPVHLGDVVVLRKFSSRWTPMLR